MTKLTEIFERKGAQEQKEAQRELRSIFKKGRKDLLIKERGLKERSENKPKWEKSKKQFDESGLLTILGKAIDLKLAESCYVDPETFDETIPEFGGIAKDIVRVGNPYFYAELHIRKTRGDHVPLMSGGYCEETKTEYVSIRIYEDGAISFGGKKLLNSAVKVPKAKWQNDKNALENTLGRAYHHPRISKEKHYYWPKASSK